MPLVIRGWFKKGFDPKSCGEAYEQRPAHGSGRDRCDEVTLIFGRSIFREETSGRWYFEDGYNARFEVCEELAQLVSGWTLRDHYPKPDPFMSPNPIVYAVEGVSGSARFEPHPGKDLTVNSRLLIDDCDTIADLEKLYLAVRRGEAQIVEVWDGKPKRPDPRDEQIAQMRRELDQLDAKIEAAVVAEKARADKAESRLRECELDLRLLREDVCRMISNIWEDMCHVSWWRSKHYLMRVVCNAMRANVVAFRCVDGLVASQAIKIFSQKG